MILAALLVAGTLAVDLRNEPDWRAMADAGFSTAIISPRARAAADSLKARGIKVLFHVQPWALEWDGVPVAQIEGPYFDFDRQLWDLAASRNAFLRTSTGIAVAHDPGVEGLVFDFSNLAFAEAYGRFMASWGADGLYGDYFDTRYGIGWVNGLQGISDAKWASWANGLRLAMLMARRTRPGYERCCFNGKAAVGFPYCDYRAYEGVGPYFANLWSYRATLDGCRAQERTGQRAIVYCQASDTTRPSQARMTAAIALLTGALYNRREHIYTEAGTVTNLRDREHFDLSLGAPLDTMKEISPWTFRRDFERGFVVAVTGINSLMVGSWWVGPGDGIVVETRDRLGYEQAWRSDR